MQTIIPSHTPSLTARMFLMNASPVVALQSKWESFGQPGSFRFPACFSESEDDIARASVSAKVQMIINNLQSEETSLGMNNEYIMQKNQKVDQRGGARPAANALARKEYHRCSADFDGPEEEGISEFGPLVLDSDSDDSVDRDIEEAIQEYLKEKSHTIQSSASETEHSGTTGGESRCKPDLSQKNVTSGLLSVKFKAGVVSESFIRNHLEVDDQLRSVSPLSVSSDDSFEQSIQAEIEQFLNQKRQREIHKHDDPVNRKPEKKETPVKSAFKSSKESTGKPRRQAWKQDYSLTVGLPAELEKTVQTKDLKSKVSAEPENLSQADGLPLKPGAPCRPKETAPNKNEGKSGLWATRRGQRTKSLALGNDPSDSSSDDGIEEAIQLYQLEKTRKAANLTVDCGLLQDAQPQPESRVTFPDSFSVGSPKSALPENRNRPLRSKRKRVTTKVTESGQGSNGPNKLLKPLKETKVSTPLVNRIAKCEFTTQVSCRAESSAELMCAEAILDISKTIMPSPVESGDRPPSANPVLGSQSVPSCPVSDDSSVDSDDSIEQEIRTFLALKAQSESLLAKPQNLSQSVQDPLLPGSNNQTGVDEASLTNTLKLSLSHKKKLKGEKKTAKQLTQKTPKELEKERPQEADCSKGKILLCQENPQWSRECRPREAESCADASRCQLLSSELVGLIDKHVTLDLRHGLSQVCGRAGRGRNVEPERSGTEDKSSSLDSDEDLDTAIKDLLRSKRKLKKKPKDHKTPCKKKVRFSGTETLFLDKLDSFQRDWKDNHPSVLKSCLSRSKKDNMENTVKKPTLNTCKSRSENNVQFSFQVKKQPEAKPVWVTDGLEASENQHSALSTVSLSDDSSTIDSDDSIEQEIRKFLAEKAKDSLHCSEGPVGNVPSFGSVGISHSEMARSLEHPATLSSHQSQRSKTASQPAGGLKNSARTVMQSAINPSHDGGKSTSCTETVYLHSTLSLKAKCETVPTKNSTGQMSVKEAPIGRKHIYNRDQSQKSPKSTSVERDVSQLQNCISAFTSSGKDSSFQLKLPSVCAADQVSGLKREPNLFLSHRQLGRNDLIHQAVLRGSTALDREGRETVRTGRLGREEEKGIKTQVKCPVTPAIKTKPNLPLAAACLKAEARPAQIQTQLFNFGESASWRGKRASFFDSYRGTPVLVPSSPAVRRNKVSPGPIKHERSNLTLQKEGGPWQNSNVQAGLNRHEIRNSCSEGKTLDFRSRWADSQSDPDHDVETDSSEFSDTPVEECRSALAKGKSPNFSSLSTSIDPGVVIQPYITLSPERLKKITLWPQNRRKMLQIGAKKLNITIDWNEKGKFTKKTFEKNL
ncbi:protein phosphatase 1 regulatory subunit 26 [Ornithorhynchus anatinus]|uniref:Protein phosphatase 1 regulatory subunit 26 n=1 Tax=Ornithorhynchus anatinus TaxID=9258 RepID=A0A6I8PES1_ORNAN|nr:protein phosphatase 1 regulatory subunit 26 [Ornithorhynchus anatinus]